MSPCADSLFYFFTSYSHIRILSLRTPLIRFFQCRLVRIHCFTFSHHIPTFEFFLLGPRSLDFSNVVLYVFIVLLFYSIFPHLNSFSWDPAILCSTFFTSYSHIRILSLRTPLIRFFQCRLVRIHCSPFLQHIPTFEFFLLGPRYSLFYFFYIIFPHSNSFS